MRKRRYITRVGSVGFGRTGKKVAEEFCRHPEVDLVCVFKKHMDESVGKDIGSYFSLKIAEAISDADSIKFGRRFNEPRIGKETVIHMIRVGGIIGKHTLIIGQPHQTLSITHESID